MCIRDRSYATPESHSLKERPRGDSVRSSEKESKGSALDHDNPFRKMLLTIDQRILRMPIDVESERVQRALAHLGLHPDEIKLLSLDDFAEKMIDEKIQLFRYHCHELEVYQKRRALLRELRRGGRFDAEDEMPHWDKSKGFPSVVANLRVPTREELVAARERKLEEKVEKQRAALERQLEMFLSEEHARMNLESRLKNRAEKNEELHAKEILSKSRAGLHIREFRTEEQTKSLRQLQKELEHRLERHAAEVNQRLEHAAELRLKRQSISNTRTTTSEKLRRTDAFMSAREDKRPLKEIEGHLAELEEKEKKAEQLAAQNMAQRLGKAAEHARNVQIRHQLATALRDEEEKKRVAEFLMRTEEVNSQMSAFQRTQAKLRGSKIVEHRQKEAFVEATRSKIDADRHRRVIKALETKQGKFEDRLNELREEATNAAEERKKQTEMRQMLVSQSLRKSRAVRDAQAEKVLGREREAAERVLDLQRALEESTQQQSLRQIALSRNRELLSSFKDLYLHQALTPEAALEKLTPFIRNKDLLRSVTVLATNSSTKEEHQKGTK
eukprot:TRINITY_DN8579_c0_g1_i10.p1 TRINITY_DN8579_c0_g1~~TRINITY_DN8579_c0_g1_i10.p1  ORF type:complete len:557 (+),score=158.04 TRINITY_DN8579_c0_g1_i10:66-1736(+)